ncbi:MAG: sigma-54-dependent Fis family transcriptional regulator [Acidobacteria bacterium]|nr:sigma-54-dependent Fis family transcriptional regulator [Acidobacteriota bacterium]
MSETRTRILVVDDEDSVRQALAGILEDEGYEVVQAASGEQGIEAALGSAPDAIFLDVWLPGIDGIATLRQLRERGAVAPVIMISGHGTIETAVRATKLGAYDFVEKPVSLERVLLVTANALRHARLERRNRALRAELRREAEFLGRSAAVERLRHDLAGATDGRPVLLYGEKGTGRRLAARWLAMHGPRPDGPFLDVQVSALPRERLIRTLYGDPARLGEEPGRIALADEGTLYLENGDTLPASVQDSLLSGIRRAMFPVPGGRAVVRAEPRLVVALLEAPERLERDGKLAGEFLAAFAHTIEIPPLRQRREDIPELAERFVGELSREYAREPLSVSPAALEVFLRHEWPGNVRELQRAIERIVLLAHGPLIGVADLPPYLMGERAAEEGDAETLRRFEEGWLRRHLEEVGGDVARAASRLGISEEELRLRMRRFGLD